MEDCATHHGSGIEEAFVRCIKALISVEKLRGTDLWLALPGAPKSGKTPALVENSLYRLRFQTVRSFPVGPPCRARLDLVIMKITAGESKRRKIQPSDRLRHFFWVSYDVSHEFKTRLLKILRGENFERVSRTVTTEANFLKLTGWFV